MSLCTLCLDLSFSFSSLSLNFLFSCFSCFSFKHKTLFFALSLYIFLPIPFASAPLRWIVLAIRLMYFLDPVYQPHSYLLILNMCHSLQAVPTILVHDIIPFLYNQKSSLPCTKYAFI